MNEILLKARAKINLTLDVINKRNDGYHNIEMIMQNINLYDKVFVKKIDKDFVKLKSNIDWLPSDERNIAYKAANFMKEKYNLKNGIFINLDKRIPIAAGLAGGSSDCAAVLIAINKIFDLKLSKNELIEIGVRFGADVPYCIMRGTVLAEGIGEKLTRLPNCPYMYVLLLKSSLNVSTSSIYKKLDLENLNFNRPNNKNIIECLYKKDKYGIAYGLSNVLETVTLSLYPNLIEYKKRLLEKGAISCLMSGSGPTIFGLFFDKDTVFKAYKSFKQEGDIRDVILTDIYTPKNRRSYIKHY